MKKIMINHTVPPQIFSKTKYSTVYWDLIMQNEKNHLIENNLSCHLLPGRIFKSGVASYLNILPSKVRHRKIIRWHARNCLAVSDLVVFNTRGRERGDDKLGETRNDHDLGEQTIKHNESGTLVNIIWYKNLDIWVHTYYICFSKISFLLKLGEKKKKFH